MLRKIILKQKNMIKILNVFVTLVLAIFCSGCSNIFAVCTLVNSAKEFIEIGDIKSAISRLESAYELDKCNYEVQYLLIDSYLREKRCEDAIPYAISILKLEKSEAATYRIVGETYMCTANDIYKDEIYPLQKDNSEIDKRVQNKYIYNLTKANESLNQYYNLSPHTEEASEIVETIQKNNEKLDNFKRVTRW